jgi:hypothetical protein
MSLFESFNRPGWEHDDPEVRKAAVEELEDEAVLAGLVRDDPDERVRARALARISDSGLLDEFADQLTGPLQKQARGQRLAQLLPDEGQLDSIRDEALLIRIAGLADDAGLVDRAIARIGSPERLMEVAANHPVARVRVSAAQNIDDLDTLAELMHHAKHKDKSVFRHCKDRLDRHHAHERLQAERQERLQQLAADAAQLAVSVDSPEYKARFQTLEARWQELREYAGEEQAQQIRRDLGTCSERIGKVDREHAASEQQQALAEEAVRAFGQIIDELEQMALPSAVTEERAGPTDFFRLLDGIEDRWLAAMRHAQPAPEQFKACKGRLRHWRNVAQSAQRLFDSEAALTRLGEAAGAVDKSDYLALQKLEKDAGKLLAKLTWPESLAAAKPEAIRRLEEQRDGLAAKLANLTETEEKNLERLKTAFDEFKEELGTNHFNNADRALNRLRNVLRRLGPGKQERYQHELRPLLARLKEIHDWQGFAIEPKKLDLIERMRALVGTDEDPDVLAGKIKALQSEWKALGHLSPRRDQALWKRFSAAADEAYEPCKQAFALQADRRKENFRQRMALVAQLVEYEQRIAWPDADDPDPDAPRPDWKMVQKTLDTARAAFNEIKPVDRKAERKSRKALKTVCDRIYGHIRLEYERNIEQKKELVSQARTLVDVEDLREATDGAKRIQREWKSVGITPRNVDRKLWKALREACDAVFARLDAQREQRNAAVRERAEKAAEHKRKALERWPRLLDRLRACALKAQDEAAATALWEQEGGIPRGIEEQALETYWLEGPDDETPAEQLRDACIALEVLAGLDSPEEDKEARMAYQMQRLVEGLGSGRADSQQQLLEQINAFLALRPPADWAERFCKGVAAIRSP